MTPIPPGIILGVPKEKANTSEQPEEVFLSTDSCDLEIIGEGIDFSSSSPEDDEFYHDIASSQPYQIISKKANTKCTPEKNDYPKNLVEVSTAPKTSKAELSKKQIKNKKNDKIALLKYYLDQMFGKGKTYTNIPFNTRKKLSQIIDNLLINNNKPDQVHKKRNKKLVNLTKFLFITKFIEELKENEHIEQNWGNLGLDNENKIEKYLGDIFDLHYSSSDYNFIRF